jgi:hypothetical protein
MGSSAQARPITLLAEPGHLSANAFLRFLVVVGVLNSLIAAFLLCRLPAAHTPSLTALFIRAVVYVAIGALAGTAGSWFYWRRSSAPFSPDFPVTFRLFALVCAIGWIWAPAIVLFSSQDSAVTPALSTLASALLAAYLRKIFPSANLDAHPSVHAWQDRELFTDSTFTVRHEWHGYVIAVCLYAAFYALGRRWILDAGCLFAFCAFLFAWKRTLAPAGPVNSEVQSARAARRLAYAALPAILVTVSALLFGVARRNQAFALRTVTGRAADAVSHPRHRDSGFGISGYESIILWPVPEKKQIVPPAPEINLLAKGTKRSLVIRFTGAYWYFQPPDKQPGPRALQAHGTPLATNIRSTNTFPLLMEAHQHLAAPIRLATCAEIQVGIESRNGTRGPVSMAVLLTDSASPKKSTVYLGQQTFLPGNAADSSIGSSAGDETLRFFIPARASIRKFDEITLMFFPEVGYFETGPKVAIDRFNLIPR